MYLQSDEAYIQKIANDSGNITQSEENALNIIAVCECFFRNKVEASDVCFNLIFKYLESIAYNRLVMEYATSLLLLPYDYDWKYYDKMREIWIAYFNDGRYGATSRLNIYGDSEMSICQRFSIGSKLRDQLIKLFEDSSVHSMFVNEFKKCKFTSQSSTKELEQVQYEIDVARESLPKLLNPQDFK